MDNTIQLLTDPRTVSEYARQAVAAIISGEVDPLTAYVNIQKVKKVIEEVAKNQDVTRVLIDYVNKRGSGREGMTVGDCKVQACEAGVTYDFSGCGDPVLADLYAEADTLKERIKGREELLKGIKGSLQVLDDITGEVYTLYPPARTSKTTVKLTFKK